MALDFQREHEDQREEARGRFYIVSERLYKTKDGEIVKQGDPDANSLWKAEGAKVLMEEAIELGLVTEEEKVEKKQAAAKKGKTAANKQKDAAKNKAKGGK